MRFRRSGRPAPAAVMRVTGAVMQARRPIIEWARVLPRLPEEKAGGRPREHDLRRIVDGIFICCDRDVSGTCCPKIFRPRYPPMANGLSLLPRLAPGWDPGSSS